MHRESHATKPLLLVVEEDRLLRWSLREKFASAGWEVLEAGEGLAALTVAADRPVDLALVAASLPDLDGGALAARLFQAHPSTRIVLMTSTERPGSVAPWAGGWPLLEKPFDLDELVSWASSFSASSR
ncbi:MAG: response regulator [Thermoanaerobaculia bacterium]